MDWNRVTVLRALESGDLLELGAEADQVRQLRHPEGAITYSLRETAGAESTSIDLHNLDDAGLRSSDAIATHMREERDKRRAELTFHNLPAALLKDASHLRDTLRQLHAAGLRSIALDLHPGVRVSKNTAALLEEAAANDVAIFATWTMGQGESLKQRAESLIDLRSLQEATRAVCAVLVRVHHDTNPEARREEEATAVEYLRTLAATRLVLDNVQHVQTDWTVLGPKVLELALRFGADDAGAVAADQSASREPSHHGGESELRRIIRDAGFQPVERDPLFRQSMLH